MLHSESLVKIAPAVVLAQAELQNAPKDCDNPYFHSKYADLATCMDTLKPVLSKNGLAVMQFPFNEADDVKVETVLMHTSGEWLSTVAGCRPKDMTPQSVGSAITYLRRYGLSIIGLVTDEDDDGNAGTHKEASKTAPRQTAAKAPTIQAKPQGTGNTPEQDKRAAKALSGSNELVKEYNINGTMTKFKRGTCCIDGCKPEPGRVGKDGKIWVSVQYGRCYNCEKAGAITQDTTEPPITVYDDGDLPF